MNNIILNMNIGIHIKNTISLGLDYKLINYRSQITHWVQLDGDQNWKH